MGELVPLPLGCAPLDPPHHIGLPSGHAFAPAPNCGSRGGNICWNGNALALARVMSQSAGAHGWPRSRDTPRVYEGAREVYEGTREVALQESADGRCSCSARPKLFGRCSTPAVPVCPEDGMRSSRYSSCVSVGEAPAAPTANIHG